MPPLIRIEEQISNATFWFWILMFCGAAFATPGAYGLDLGVVFLQLGVVGARRKFYQGMQRHRHPRTFFLRFLHEVGVDAANDGLMRDDEYVLAAFELHDDGLEADDHIAVALATAVAVIVLILVARLEIFRVLIRNFLVRQPVADTSVEFIQRFPLELVVVLRQVTGCGDGAFQRRRPDSQWSVALNGVSARHANTRHAKPRLGDVKPRAWRM